MMTFRYVLFGHFSIYRADCTIITLARKPFHTCFGNLRRPELYKYRVHILLLVPEQVPARLLVRTFKERLK